tara:strand:+ start:1244 stop:2314 length:1071 start_codon:yes stop_codon:yes gene_type:complete
MRVLQLIDSLRPGGAEKMAVNIANTLLPHIEGSYLCCTRKEGALNEQLNNEVEYLFLKKRYSLDIRAIYDLQKYIKKQHIDVVHAHSSSYFLAGILRFLGIRFKLVWHDHYGNSEFLEKRKTSTLKLFSIYFDGVISVNETLKNWALKKLLSKNVIEISNFITSSPIIKNDPPFLRGDSGSFKIICLANFRPQKDHLNLLKAFEIFAEKIPASLHLIGEIPKDSYTTNVLEYIKGSRFTSKIYCYGVQSEVKSLLLQADLGVLSSRSEGLPLALLEYGQANLPVVVTDVGQCRRVLNGFGYLIPSENFYALADAFFDNYENREESENDSLKFQKHIESVYSEYAVIKNIKKFYNEL